MSKLTKPTERCGAPRGAIGQGPNNLVTNTIYRTCTDCNTTCQHLKYGKGCLSTLKSLGCNFFGVTLKDNLRVHKHEQLANLNDYLDYFKGDKYINIVDYGYEIDKNNKLHLHCLFSTLQQLHEFRQGVGYVRPRGMHVDIKELKTEFDIKRWHKYMYKVPMPDNQVFMEHELQLGYAFINSPENETWAFNCDPLDHIIPCN